MELMELYEQNGGATLSRRTLLEKVEGQFGDDIVSFHSKGVATLVVFKDHVASTLIIVCTEDDDEITLKKLGKKLLQELKTVQEAALAGMTDASLGGLIQVIIDNFDAVIHSQNCRLDCHNLAMIVTHLRMSPCNVI